MSRRRGAGRRTACRASRWAGRAADPQTVSRGSPAATRRRDRGRPVARVVVEHPDRQAAARRVWASTEARVGPIRSASSRAGMSTVTGSATAAAGGRPGGPGGAGSARQWPAPSTASAGPRHRQQGQARLIGRTQNVAAGDPAAQPGQQQRTHGRPRRPAATDGRPQNRALAMHVGGEHPAAAVPTGTRSSVSRPVRQQQRGQQAEQHAGRPRTSRRSSGSGSRECRAGPGSVSVQVQWPCADHLRIEEQVPRREQRRRVEGLREPARRRRGARPAGPGRPSSSRPAG